MLRPVFECRDQIENPSGFPVTREKPEGCFIRHLLFGEGYLALRGEEDTDDPGAVDGDEKDCLGRVSLQCSFQDFPDLPAGEWQGTEGNRGMVLFAEAEDARYVTGLGKTDVTYFD